MYKNLLLTLSLFSTAASAQDVAWVKQTGSSGANIMSSGMVVDASGNHIIRGAFSGTVDFDPGPGTFNLTALGASDAFVQKLDAQGNFLWAVRIGNSGRDRALAVTTDASNNVYILGQFIGTVDMNPGTGTFNLTSSTATTENCFVMRLSASGTFSWARREVPMLGSDMMMNEQASIDLDNTGFLYTCYSYNTQFYQHLSRYAATFGGLSWQRQIKGNANVGIDKINNATMQVDKAGNVYVAGTYEGTVDLNPSNSVFNGFTAMGMRHGFVAKLNNSGSYLWSQQITADYIVGVNAIAIDNSNNLLLAGNFTGTADFDPGSGTMSEVSSPIGSFTQGMYLLQLDNSGVFNWVKAYQSSGSDSADMTSISISPNTSAIYVSGTFSGRTDFNPKGFFPAYLQSFSLNDAFVAKLSSTGSFVWVKHLGGNNDETAPEVSAISSGDVVVSGVFNGSFSVDASAANGGTLMIPAGISDAYLAKISSCGSLSNKISRNGKDITAQEANATSYAWIDCKTNAPVADATKKTFTPTKNGSYAVIITHGTCSVTSECMVIESLNVSDGLSAGAMKVYPNPTAGAVRIDLGNEYQNVSIEVRSSLGQLVSRNEYSGGQYFNFDIDGAPGTYFIYVKTDKVQGQLRLVKQ